MANPPDAILIPLDGSELAEIGVDYATMLAERLGARLLLFTSVSGDEKAALEEFARYEGIALDEAADAHLHRIAASIPAGVRVEQHHSHDPNAAAAIIDHARDHDVSMIVMASHGRSGVSRWLLGSVADKVVQTSPVPVVVVPARR
ncbi:MAG: universal stress protein [Actinomycetota bacterium]